MNTFASLRQALPFCWRILLLLALTCGFNLPPAPQAQAAQVIPPLVTAYNPLTNLLYEVHSSTDVVSVFRPGSGEVVATVPVGSYPVAVAVDSRANRAYVANQNSSNLTIINGEGFTTQTVTVGSAPSAVAVNPATGRVYVANKGSSTVTVLAEDGGVAGSFSAAGTISVAPAPALLAVNPVTNRIYVGSSTTPALTVINGSTGAASDVPLDYIPTSIVIQPQYNRVYVPHEWNLTVLDGATNQKIAHPNNQDCYHAQVAVDTGTNITYIACSTTGSFFINVWDEAAWQSTLLYNGWMAVNRFALAVNTVSHQVYALYDNNDDTSLYFYDSRLELQKKWAHMTISIIHQRVLSVAPEAGYVLVSGLGTGPDNNIIFNARENKTMAVPAGSQPVALAVNRSNNRVYAANQGSGTVTEIDGSTGEASAPIPVGSSPVDVDVNPFTNRIYVANQASGTVTAINGADHTTSTITVGAGPVDVAVNSMTNQVFTANRAANSVTIIDGETQAALSVAAGTAPTALAVNPVTNQVYTANEESDSVTIIDGFTRDAQAIPVGDQPVDIVVDPALNRIYTANRASGSITVIDGSTRQTTTLPLAAGSPVALDVDPVSGTLYCVVEYGPGLRDVQMLKAGSTQFVAAQSNYVDITDMRVNPANQQMYSLDNTGQNLVQARFNVPLKAQLQALAFNPLTGQVFIASKDSNSVLIVTEGVPNTPTTGDSSEPRITHITHDPHSPAAAPTFDISVSGSAMPGQKVYYQVDSTSGRWFPAEKDGDGWQVKLPAQYKGEHILYAMAVDAYLDTIHNATTSPVVGPVSGFLFRGASLAHLVATAPDFTPASDSVCVTGGQAEVFGAAWDPGAFPLTKLDENIWYADLYTYGSAFDYKYTRCASWNVGEWWWLDAEHHLEGMENRSFSMAYSSPSASQGDIIWNWHDPLPVRSEPAAGDARANPAAPLNITWSRALNPASLSASTFQVTGPGGAVTGTTGYVNDAEGPRIQFTPSTPWKTGATYTVTVTTGLQAENGMNLQSPLVITFTAGSRAYLPITQKP